MFLLLSSEEKTVIESKMWIGDGWFGCSWGRR